MKLRAYNEEIQVLESVVFVSRITFRRASPVLIPRTKQLDSNNFGCLRDVILGHYD